MKYMTIVSSFLFIQFINASLFDFIPPAKDRDPSKCEDYESEYYDNEYLGCDMSCQVTGYLGTLQIRSPPRKLNVPKYDGAYCLTKVAIKPKRGSNSGIEFYRQGSCMKGVCEPYQPYSGPIPVDIGVAEGVGAPMGSAPVGGASIPAVAGRDAPMAPSSGGVSSTSPIYCPPYPVK
ncbi:hypothetical protein BJ944DRAFT_228921 [Cunninghamella echinulata]|nr:hypothetical protein BJ944DRAFT_228921 [Cunninghamella echinulata]